MTGRECADRGDRGAGELAFEVVERLPERPHALGQHDLVRGLVVGRVLVRQLTLRARELERAPPPSS